MRKKNDVLLIVPAYNEAKNILNVISEVLAHCPNYDYIVVNDGSTDETEELLTSKRISHLSLPVNLGIGGAVQTGYRFANENGYSIAVQVDGDGQHDVSQIPKLLRAIEEGADMAIGSRFIEKQGYQSSKVRRVGIRIISLLIRICTGTKVEDVTSGFRAVSRHYIEVFASDYPQDYPEPESIVSASVSGAIVKEVPVTMREREAGKSSIANWKSVYYMIKVCLAIMLRKVSGKNKGE